MDIRFDGKRVLVTGAGKGIGRGIALKLAACGAQVVAISRTQSDLDSLKQEAPGVETHVCDLSDWDATRKVIKSLGRIDLLVNNVGVSCPVPFVEVTKEVLYNRFDINFMSAFNITQVVVKDMIARGEGGTIVNISSVTAMKAFAGRSVYCCTKAAMDQLTRSLAQELGPHKIRVNSVNPTVVLTPMTINHGWTDPAKASTITDKTPLGRLADIEDVTNATLFLLSDKASMTTGSSMLVDGGIVTSL